MSTARAVKKSSKKSTTNKKKTAPRKSANRAKIKRKATARKTPTTVTASDFKEITHEQISLEAYYIWEREGYIGDQEAVHWARAERELRSRMSHRGNS